MDVRVYVNVLSSIFLFDVLSIFTTVFFFHAYGAIIIVKSNLIHVCVSFLLQLKKNKGDFHLFVIPLKKLLGIDNSFDFLFIEIIVRCLFLVHYQR